MKIASAVLMVLALGPLAAGCGGDDGGGGRASSGEPPRSDVPDCRDDQVVDCPSDDVRATVVKVAEEVLTAAHARDGAGVCRHASPVLLKLISDDPQIEATPEQCAEFVPENVESYGDPPAPGSYTFQPLNFQKLGDDQLSAYVTVAAKDAPQQIARVDIQRDLDGGWRIWQCCDFTYE